MNNLHGYTALSLLEKLIEFIEMTNESVEWSFEEQSGNPPKLVRLQEIQSLMKAFVPELITLNDIRWSIENFFAGNFLLNRSLEEYSKLIHMIDKTIDVSRLSGTPKVKLDVYDLRTNFSDLLDFYIKLQKLLNHNLNYMEINYSYLFSYVVTDAINGFIRSETIAISNLLVEFIDPQKRSFTEEELVANFKYPAVDLIGLDHDWK